MSTVYKSVYKISTMFIIGKTVEISMIEAVL